VVIQDQDGRPLRSKLASAIKRPFIILFTQPIVMIMALYQAIIFGTVYTLFTNLQNIFGETGGYGFSTSQVGLLYLSPGLGFLAAVWFIVPKIDTVYNKLSQRNNGEGLPEYRLPLANIGAVLLPTSLFWFAWTVETHRHWLVPVSSLFFFGIGQVSIFNTVQNYYIDSFEQYAASAIAAGSVFRSLVGGIVPLLASPIFNALGWGWGMSIFGFLSLALAPSPILLYIYGQRIRERFAIEL